MTSTIEGAKVIVVGGGLAGLSAAHTILERGGRVLVLDKKEFLGGNSVKATSGINGALTQAQIKLKIPDTAALFEKDSALSANKGKSEESTPLIHTLTYESAPAVEWLIGKFGLDLSLVSRLGGHSQPRTHRGGERFPGMTITYALMEKFEELAKEDPKRAQVIVSARATKLLKDSTGTVIGTEYVHDGQTYTEYGPVVISTGGYGADFSEDSILKKVRPDLMPLPTTNGDHNTGDGIKMTSAIGGATVDLEAIQVHPTGLVHPDEPDAKLKFLAAEALRGVGGLLLDANGKRFSDELGTRDYVSGEMFKNKGPFRLLLNSKGVKEIEWHCKHYVGRGLMRHCKTGAEVAKEMGISPSALSATFKKYNEDAKAGGVKINEFAEILSDSNAPIPGLYASGEVAGGVHGKNRLGGSGLLGAVVYGRVAGASSSKYLLNQLSTGATNANRRVGAVMNQFFSSVHIKQSDEGLVITLGNDNGISPSRPQDSAGAKQAPKPKPAEAKKAPSRPTQRVDITMEEVAKHNSDNDCWVVVNGEVLDATPFLDKHPGGRKAILLYAGKDATEEFNMLHKPDVVEKYAPEIVLGKLKK